MLSDDWRVGRLPGSGRETFRPCAKIANLTIFGNFQKFILRKLGKNYLVGANHKFLRAQCGYVGKIR